MSWSLPTQPKSSRCVCGGGALALLLACPIGSPCCWRLQPEPNSWATPDWLVGTTQLPTWTICGSSLSWPPHTHSAYPMPTKCESLCVCWTLWLCVCACTCVCMHVCVPVCPRCLHSSMPMLVASAPHSSRLSRSVKPCATRSSPAQTGSLPTRVGSEGTECLCTDTWTIGLQPWSLLAQCPGHCCPQPTLPPFPSFPIPPRACTRGKAVQGRDILIKCWTYQTCILFTEQTLYNITCSRTWNLLLR